jgi:hypothetical protein
LNEYLENCSICDLSLDHCIGLHCNICKSLLKTDKKQKISQDQLTVIDLNVSQNPITIIEEKVPAKIIGECIVCCDDMTIDTVISCNDCKQTCCNKCFIHYILESGLDVKCMHQSCNHQIDFNYIHNLGVKDIELHRSNLLLNTEQSKLNGSASAAESYKFALEKKSRLPFNSEGEYTGKSTDQTKINNHHVLYHQIILCIEKFGIGYENFDWENVKTLTNTINKSFKCPNGECNGRVKESKCITCFINVCMECHEIIHNSNHICNPDTLSTIKSIENDSKPCPVCCTLIFKIEGCDQMFCTQCHTTYSWLTSNIETGFKHNQHYLDWIRQKRLENPNVLNQAEEPIQVDSQCNKYISYDDLKKCFSISVWRTSFEIREKLPKINNIYSELPSETYYCLAIRNLHSKILTMRATIGNHLNVPEPDNHDLRVLYIIGEISEVEFKKQLYERHLKYIKSRKIFDIYEFVFHCSSDIFSNLFVGKFSKSKIISYTYLELQRLLEIANKYLSAYDKTIIRFCQKPFN